MQGQGYRYPNKEPSGQTLDGRVQFQWKSSRENSTASAAVSPPDELSIVQYLLCHCVEVVVFPFFPDPYYLPIIRQLFFPDPLFFLALFKVEHSFRCTPAAIRPSFLRALSFENVVKKSGEAILAVTFLEQCGLNS